MAGQHELTMNIQPKIIDHLGINMYTNLHAVLSELIANSWDADADSVHIVIPSGSITPSFSITIKDDGSGMDFEELNDFYLQVGRNRRGVATDQKTPKGRKILGRKGIGKFAAFGVAKQVQIKSVKNRRVTEFKMDIDGIKSVGDGDVYKPEIIRHEETNESDGVTITLYKLMRKRQIDVETLRRGLANRFIPIGREIHVFLNSEEITETDAKIEDVEYTWKVDEPVSDKHADWKISGTICSKKGTIRETHNRGVTLYARNKLVQEPTFFGATSGKEYAYNHLFGRLHADFLDGKNDVIATNRSSINWESEEGETVMNWGAKKLAQISNEWAEKRVKGRTDRIKSRPEFSEWFNDLPAMKKQKATKVFGSIAKNEDLSDARVVDLAGYVRDVFKFDAFQDLSQKIEEAPAADVPKVIDLFRDWEHLEASEMHRIMKGRLSTINKMDKYIKDDAKEVPTIHKYLKKFPWIMDPRWHLIYDEVRLSSMLKEKFPDRDASERRIDFLCFSSTPALIVIELKRPGLAVGKKELDQLREYCLFLEEHKGGTDPEFSHSIVCGYLICENEQQSNAYSLRKTKMAEQNMFVRKYSELLRVAKETNGDIISKYEELKSARKGR